VSGHLRRGRPHGRRTGTGMGDSSAPGGPGCCRGGHGVIDAGRLSRGTEPAEPRGTVVTDVERYGDSGGVELVGEDDSKWPRRGGGRRDGSR